MEELKEKIKNSLKEDVVCFNCEKGYFQNDDFGFSICSYCKIFFRNFGHLNELINLQTQHAIQCGGEARFLRTIVHGYLTSLMYVCCDCESAIEII